MNEMFRLWLKENDWIVELNTNKFDYKENSILNKYNDIPVSFINILKEYSNISSKDDTTWFICGKDYLDKSDDVFKWNEFELMSLEAAEEDEKWKMEIKNWGRKKLTFIMSVSGGYSYYAIDLEDNKGTIIYGQEPEFEDANVVAKEFDEFIDKIVKKEIIL